MNLFENLNSFYFIKRIVVTMRYKLESLFYVDDKMLSWSMYLKLLQQQ